MIPRFQTRCDSGPTRPRVDFGRIIDSKIIAEKIFILEFCFHGSSKMILLSMILPPSSHRGLRRRAT